MPVGFTDKFRGCHRVVTGVAHRAGKEITMQKRQAQDIGDEMRSRGILKTVTQGLVIAASLLAPLVAAAGEITVKGSDTMVILGQRWAEEYMRVHPSATIQVTGGGSGTGISALINGTTDICQASRTMSAAEKEKLRDRYATVGVEIPVARDGLSVYVNASNPLGEVTMDQLKLIFTGKVTNWKELGGTDAKIVVYSRENSSGTYVFFKEHVLKNADYTVRAQSMPGTAAVVNAVAKEKFGIGYGGAAYAKGIKLLKVKKDADSPAIAPDEAHVKDGSYPLSRPLFFYLRNKPTGDVGAFVDWVLSAQGQAVVTKVGYYPLK
jgi:phosphate transport system substrate-binding protein